MDAVLTRPKGFAYGCKGLDLFTKVILLSSLFLCSCVILGMSFRLQFSPKGKIFKYVPDIH